MTDIGGVRAVSPADEATPDDACLPGLIPRWLRFAIACFIALGIVFRVYHIDRKVLWEDEIYGTIHMLGYTESQIVRASHGFTDAADIQKYFTLPDARQARPITVIDTFRSIAGEDPQHPPVYYVLGHLWAECFGTSVAAMRSLPALFGILTLPCVYFLCIELFASRTAAWLGVVVVAISPFHVLYAQEVREYSLWTVATLVMCLTLLRATRLASLSGWVLYCITLTLSMYIYPLSALIAFGEGAFLIVVTRTRSPKAVLGYLIACLVALTLFLPWLLIMIRSAGLHRGLAAIFATHVGPLSVIKYLIDDVRSAFFDFGLYHYGLVRPVSSVLLSLFIIALIGYALATLVRSENRDAPSFALIALCLPMMPLVAHDLVFGGELVNQSRYFTPLYLGIELLIVDLFRRKLAVRSATNRVRGAVQLALVVLLAGGALSCAVMSQAETWANKDFEQSRSIAQIINRSDRPLVVSDFHTSRILGLAYYLDPNVKMKLNLQCDLCTIPSVQPINMLGESGTAGAIFLLGPSSELQREAKRWAAGSHRGADIQTIEVQIFPDRKRQGSPLTLFAPV